MELYLVRHAIAEERDPQRWPDDAQRPLSERGRARFARAAAGLRTLGVQVDVLLSSPYARAWATAEILSEEADWPPPLALQRAAPGQRPDRLLAELGRVTTSANEAVALVGHDPDLQRLASFLLSGVATALSADWRRGGVARLTCPRGLRPGGAVLTEYLPPRVLRRIAARSTSED